jgi:hypothetical protein
MLSKIFAEDWAFKFAYSRNYKRCEQGQGLGLLLATSICASICAIIIVASKCYSPFNFFTATLATTTIITLAWFTGFIFCIITKLGKIYVTLPLGHSYQMSFSDRLWVRMEVWFNRHLLRMDKYRNMKAIIKATSTEHPMINSAYQNYAKTIIFS